jgi:hypothetical protein
MDMFKILLEMLYTAFDSMTVSEQNYHDIVRCMRVISPIYRPLSVDEQNEVIKRFGNSRSVADYNPFEHFENIRYALSFGDDCPAINMLVKEFDTHV